MCAKNTEVVSTAGRDGGSRVEEMVREVEGIGGGWASVRTLAHVLNERKRGLMNGFDLICVIKEFLQLLYC